MVSVETDGRGKSILVLAPLSKPASRVHRHRDKVILEAGLDAADVAAAVAKGGHVARSQLASTGPAAQKLGLRRAAPSGQRGKSATETAAAREAVDAAPSRKKVPSKEGRKGAKAAHPTNVRPRKSARIAAK